MDGSDPSSTFERDTGTLDERLRAALAKLSLAARHDFRRRAARDGLSAVQAQILERLTREGPLALGELARRVGLTAATVSDSVAALERRTLVRRRTDPGDRRRRLVACTARGRRLGSTLAAWPDLFGEAVGGLARPEKEALFVALQRMILRLLERGALQRVGMCRTCAHFRANAHPGAGRPHHCALVDVALDDAALRLDCPDHEPGPTASEALARLGPWRSDPR